MLYFSRTERKARKPFLLLLCRIVSSNHCHLEEIVFISLLAKRRMAYSVLRKLGAFLDHV